MIIPELILQYTIKSIVDLINEDWDSTEKKEDTILYDLFYKDDNGFPMVMNKFNYLDQAKSIFLRSSGDPRKLQVTVGYNIERNGLPTIHILLPQENESDKGIGMGAGYQPDFIDEEEGIFSETFTNVFKSTYNLMITSDNSSEAILIYHALKNVLFSIFEHFELMGLRDPKFGGQDLQFNNDLVPPTVFHRNLLISFFYETTVKSILRQKLIKSLSIVGTPFPPIEGSFNLSK